MVSKEKIKKILKDAFTSGWSLQKLNLSACIGVFIAFSPFPGAHTIMMIVTKWFFGLNFPILFIATSLNNPWTMIPFFTLDYVFGHWFIHDLLGWSPSLVISLEKILGSGQICLWSFLVGGNILGALGAIVSYPLINVFFKKLLVRYQQPVAQAVKRV